MSAKTKIVVLRMKELIYTGIFAAVGILLIILLLTILLPGRSDTPDADVDVVADTVQPLYIPGLYTTELTLGNHTVSIEVLLNKNTIASVRLNAPDEAITTMYPLLEPTLESIAGQLYETQSIDSVSYTTDNKYTSMILIEAIRQSLEKATPTPEPSADTPET